MIVCHQIHKTSIKPWPCCRHTHPAIDAALEISSKVDGGNIESIELGVTQATLDVCDKPTPETLYDAKFSLQHCVSVAILDGQVGFDAFEYDARQRVANMAIKISLERNEEIEKAYPNAWGAEVKVKLTNGKEFSVRRKHAKGDPDAPLSPTEFKEKATMLFRFGGVSEPEGWVDRILELDRVSSFRDSELIDLRTVSPIDYDTINKSIKKTGRVIVLDTGNSSGSIAGEIIAKISMNLFKFLKNPPKRIALPDVPTPTSFSLTKNFYPGSKEIADTILNILRKKINTTELSKDRKFHDVPGDWFKGPF